MFFAQSKFRLLLFAFLSITILSVSCRKPKTDVVVPPVQDSLVLFQLNELPEIKLEVPVEQWNKLLQNFDINPQNEEYIVAHYTFRQGSKEVKLDSMAIRIRGNTSRRRPEGSTGQLHNAATPDWHHAHFALKFDKYKKTQKFNGLSKVNLKWFKDDAAYAREVYCYELFLS